MTADDRKMLRGVFLGCAHALIAMKQKEEETVDILDFTNNSKKLYHRVLSEVSDLESRLSMLGYEYESEHEALLVLLRFCREVGTHIYPS